MESEFEAFAPGEFIRDELEARGWTQTDLAEIMGRHVAVVNQIINAKTEVTLKTAQELAAAFGTSAEFWLNLENSYKLAQSQVDNSAVARRAKLFGIAPVAELQKRNWIPETRNIDDLESNVLKFLRIPSIDEKSKFYAAARKAEYAETTAAQVAWLSRVREIAEALPAEKFSLSKVEKYLDELHALTASEMEIRKVPEILGRMGIRFLVVQHLPQTKIDGYTLWLSSSRPVIALSLRYDRIDGFWFTLAHELSHVMHGDEAPIDVGLVGDSDEVQIEDEAIRRMELRANQDASHWLIPREKLDSFVLRTQPRFSKARILQFANLHKVHPGIVVGQLQYRKLIEYRHSREMLVGVRNQITDAAVTDGWGHYPSF